MTPTQKRILRDFIRCGGSNAGRKNIPWLESVLGIHIQSETVRGEGTCLYPLCDVDMNVVKATAAKVLGETL